MRRTREVDRRILAPKIAPTLTIAALPNQPHRVGETIPFDTNGRYFVGRREEDLEQAVVVRVLPGRVERTGRSSATSSRGGSSWSTSRQTSS